MISTEQSVDSPLEVVDGVFTVTDTMNDPTAFFNTRKNDTEFDSISKLGGLKSLNSAKKQNIIFAPTATPTTGGSCSGNCQSCAFSFLCQSAVKSLTNPGATLIPRL